MNDDSIPVNPDPTRKNVSIPLTSGWIGFAMTAVIIAIRAFQPGAEPMSQWSFLSWMLILIPALLPLYTWAVIGLLWFSARAAVSLLEKLLNGRKR